MSARTIILTSALFFNAYENLFYISKLPSSKVAKRKKKSLFPLTLLRMFSRTVTENYYVFLFCFENKVNLYNI